MKGVINIELFIWAWFLVTFILIYLPVDYQVHLLNGWQIPISILATQGLFKYILPRVYSLFERRKWRLPAYQVQRWLAVALIVSIIPTNLYLFAWRFIELSRHDYPYYLHNDEINGFEWLDQNVQPDDVVLSSLMIGQYIPALTGAHAFLAHWAQTVDFYDKSEMVDAFFAKETGTDQREAILMKFGVDFIYYGPIEKSLGNFDPDSVPYLKQVYRSPLVYIYRVVPQ